MAVQSYGGTVNLRDHFHMSHVSSIFTPRICSSKVEAITNPQFGNIRRKSIRNFDIYNLSLLIAILSNGIAPNIVNTNISFLIR